jgi:hypothetical protein
MDFRVIGHGDVDWIQVVQERDIAYAVMNLGVP